MEIESYSGQKPMTGTVDNWENAAWSSHFDFCCNMTGFDVNSMDSWIYSVLAGVGGVMVVGFPDTS